MMWTKEQIHKMGPDGSFSPLRGEDVEQIRARPQIGVMLEELDKEVSALSEKLGELANRVQSVLSVPGPDTPVAAQPEQPARCEMGERLRQNIERIRLLRFGVSDLIRRLEL